MSSDAHIFDGVLPFVLTAEARSFGDAARRLGMTTSAVSKAVARLEASLGARLMQRTSRAVTLTVEGEAFLARARDAVASVLAARELVAQQQRAPRGLLRVTLPPTLGRSTIVPALPQLLARHPHLRIQALLTNRVVPLEPESLDAAVRIGSRAGEGSVRRLLRVLRWSTVASPEYLARAGEPTSPEQLARHNCLRFVTPAGETPPWVLAHAGRTSRLAVEGNLVSDDGDALVDAAVAGAGVVQAHDVMVAAALARGRLVEVLRDHAAEGPPVYVVIAPGRASSPRVRAFVDFVVALLSAGGADR